VAGELKGDSAADAAGGPGDESGRVHAPRVAALSFPVEAVLGDGRAGFPLRGCVAPG
jgi:hypothetical protein